MQDKNYKLTLKKDWMFILLIAIGGSLILLLIFYSLDEALKLDRKSLLSGNDKKIALFNKKVTLICTQKSSVFSNALLVNKRNGWKVFHQKYFQKNEWLINIVNCSTKI